jgi:hypothetical protein
MYIIGFVNGDNSVATQGKAVHNMLMWILGVFEFD